MDATAPTAPATMALPALNVSLERLHVNDRAPPAPTSMDQEGMEHLPRFAEGMEFLPPGGRSVMSESESDDPDDEEHDYHDWEPGYGAPDRRGEGAAPRPDDPRAPSSPTLRRSIPMPPPPPPPVELDPPGARETIAKRMGLTLSQYERGLAITAGQMGFWRTELALGNIDEGKEWRQELALFKFMVHRPMPEPPETMEWLMAFQGPLERAVRDMRAMRASGEFDDFWSDPVAMLRAGGQGELADRYVATFPQEEIEWLGHAHEELELDLSGARTDPERQMIEAHRPAAHRRGGAAELGAQGVHDLPRAAHAHAHRLPQRDPLLPAHERDPQEGGPAGDEDGVPLHAVPHRRVGDVARGAHRRDRRARAGGARARSRRATGCARRSASSCCAWSCARARTRAPSASARPSRP